MPTPLHPNTLQTRLRIIIQPWLTCMVVCSVVGKPMTMTWREVGSTLSASQKTGMPRLNIGQPDGGQIGEKFYTRNEPDKPDRNAEKVDPNDLRFNHPMQAVLNDPRIRY